MKRFISIVALAVTFAMPAIASIQPSHPPDLQREIMASAPLVVHVPAPAVVRPPMLLAAVDFSPLAGLLTPGNIVAGLLVVLGLIAGALHLSDKRKQLIATGAYYAFHIVNDLDSQGVLSVSKVEAGLQQLDAWMLANGWRPLKPGEQTAAKLAFSAMSGASKVVVPIAGTLPASPPAPAAK